MASYLSLEVKFNLTTKGLCWDFQELYEKYVRTEEVLKGKEGAKKNGTVGMQMLAEHGDISMAEKDRNRKVCFQRLSVCPAPGNRCQDCSSVRDITGCRAHSRNSN